MCLTLIYFTVIVTRMIGKIQTIHLIDIGNVCTLSALSMVDLGFHCEVKIYREIVIC
jgi:energy-converting hydrogenase Eha subunit C